MSAPPKIIPGVSPMTVVTAPEHVTHEQMADRIHTTLTENGPMLGAYHKLWYECGHTWPYNDFLGIGAMKSPNDLWMYQILMNQHRPQTVIETGTYQGASALWFAILMDMLNIEDGKVYTVDFEDHRQSKNVLHPRIQFLAGDSTDKALVAAIEAELPEGGRLLISLDSDHSEGHVLRELELYASLCNVGDYLIVEDTNIGWGDGHVHTVTAVETAWAQSCECTCGTKWIQQAIPRPTPKCPVDRNNRGARGGVEDYLKAHEGEFMQDLTCERFLLTMNPGGWMRRVAECNHV